MKKQLTDYTTFFDGDTNLTNLEFHMKNNGKKRIERNRVLADYLKGFKLSCAEADLINEIKEKECGCKTGTQHCKICSGEFKFRFIDRLTSEFKKWNIGVPTQQYTPFGLMVFLKNSSLIKKENFFDLDVLEYSELKKILKRLYEEISANSFEYEIVGTNMMFNQINVSQKCIHGHIELMIKDVNKKNLGVKLTNETQGDKVNSIINSNTSYGYKIDVTDMDDALVLRLVKNYFNEIYDIIKMCNDRLTDMKVNPSKYTKADFDFIGSMSPVPVANVYLAYYRQKFLLIITPELFLKPVDLYSLETEEDFYNLKYVYDRDTDEIKLLYEKAPIMRPSIKSNEVEYDIDQYNQSQKKLIKILERGN